MGPRIALLGLAFCAAGGAQNQLDIRTGMFRNRLVTYQVVDGLAILEGDMILGTAEELEAQPKLSRSALVAPDTRLRWTNATIPYRIDADIPNPQRIRDAIAHWNANSSSSGSVISLLATGAGLSDASGIPLLPVRVQIGGQDTEVVYAGPADGQPGVVRIDARIPDGTPPGNTPVRIICGYEWSPAGTTISVQ